MFGLRLKLISAFSMKCDTDCIKDKNEENIACKLTE